MNYSFTEKAAVFNAYHDYLAFVILCSIFHLPLLALKLDTASLERYFRDMHLTVEPDYIIARAYALLS